MTTDTLAFPPGAAHHGQGRVTFALYAPGKQSVHLVGEFNGWDRTADPMTATAEGMWWIEKQFEPGAHTYQFFVDGEILICDPYARLLAEEVEFDPPRAIVEVGRQPFAWHHDAWPRPPFQDLIIYELHVGNFSPEGTLQGVIDRIGYLKDLGINAIELMPIFEFCGNEYNWGYNPAYFFTVEKSYGSPDDLRRLVDEAHGQGIAIILDIVLAHTARVHPFNRLYLYEESPWYGPGIGELNQFGFPMLDYTKPATQAFVHDVQHFWLHEFHIDGLRYDYVHGIGFREELGLPYLVKTAREARPDVYLIAEYSPEDPATTNTSGVDGAWHVAGSYALKALLGEGEFTGFHSDDFVRCAGILNPWEQGYAHAAKMVNFLESHDEERVIPDLLAAGLDETAARFKSGLGASVLFTMPGEPMLYQGQEWGEATGRILEPNPLHWELLETEGGRGLFEHYRRLCWLRRERPALRAEGYALDALYPEQKSLVYHRWNDEGDEVVVAVNFSPVAQNLTIPFPRPGRWREWLRDEVIEVQENLSLDVGSSAAVIFVRAE